MIRFYFVYIFDVTTIDFRLPEHSLTKRWNFTGILITIEDWRRIESFCRIYLKKEDIVH